MAKAGPATPAPIIRIGRDSDITAVKYCSSVDLWTRESDEELFTATLHGKIFLCRAASTDTTCAQALSAHAHVPLELSFSGIGASRKTEGIVLSFPSGMLVR